MAKWYNLTTTVLIKRCKGSLPTIWSWVVRAAVVNLQGWKIGFENFWCVTKIDLLMKMINDNYKCINDKSYPVNENGFVALTIISLIITVHWFMC